MSNFRGSHIIDKKWQVQNSSVQSKNGFTRKMVSKLIRNPNLLFNMIMLSSCHGILTITHECIYFFPFIRINVGTLHDWLKYVRRNQKTLNCGASEANLCSYLAVVRMM